MIGSLLKWAAKQSGFEDAYGGGRWLERIGGKSFREDYDNASWNKTLNDAWMGGNWLDRTGLRHLHDETIGKFNEAWGGGNWYKERLGGNEFDKAWGGGAWLDDRLGFGQFKTTDEDEPEIDDVDTDNLDIPTDDTPIDDGLDDTDDDKDDDDDKKKEVTLTDPNIDSEELSPMAGDVQMSSYLASRRRQLRNKKGRTDTMLTRGAYLQDTDNRMMLS